MIDSSCEPCERKGIRRGFIWTPPADLAFAIDACPSPQREAVHTFGHAIIEGTRVMNAEHNYRLQRARDYPTEPIPTLNDHFVDPMATEYVWDVVSSGIDGDTLVDEAESRRRHLAFARQFQQHANRIVAKDRALDEHRDGIATAVTGMGALAMSFTGSIDIFRGGAEQFEGRVIDTFLGRSRVLASTRVW